MSYFMHQSTARDFIFPISPYQYIISSCFLSHRGANKAFNTISGISYPPI